MPAAGGQSVVGPCWRIGGSASTCLHNMGASHSQIQPAPVHLPSLPAQLLIGAVHVLSSVSLVSLRELAGSVLPDDGMQAGSESAVHDRTASNSIQQRWDSTQGGAPRGVHGGLPKEKSWTGELGAPAGSAEGTGNDVAWDAASSSIPCSAGSCSATAADRGMPVMWTTCRRLQLGSLMARAWDLR